MVSIVVPVYRSEETLARCVHSLTAQTYQDIEIILVVDGPPDASGILAEQLAGEDARIRVVHQENQGVSVSRNRGIREARGEFIRFVDSDDYVSEDSIQKLVDAMTDDVEFVVAGYDHLYFGRTIPKSPKEVGVFETRLAKEAVLSLYEAGYFNMPWNKLYRKELIRAGFPTDLNLGEDLCFNLQYLQKCNRFCVIPDLVCEYIQDDRGTTLSTKRRTDKIPIAFRLFDVVRGIFGAMYGSDEQVARVLASKLTKEFLDDIEGLAFDASLDKRQKQAVILEYMQARKELAKRCPGAQIVLSQFDYKIIYHFFKKDMLFMTYVLVQLRGICVKLLRRR